MMSKSNKIFYVKCLYTICIQGHRDFQFHCDSGSCEESHVKSGTHGDTCFSGKAIKSGLNKLSPSHIHLQDETNKYQRNGMNTGMRGKKVNKI